MVGGVVCGAWLCGFMIMRYWRVSAWYFYLLYLTNRLGHYGAAHSWGPRGFWHLTGLSDISAVSQPWPGLLAGSHWGGREDWDRVMAGVWLVVSLHCYHCQHCYHYSRQPQSQPLPRWTQHWEAGIQLYSPSLSSVKHNILQGDKFASKYQILCDLARGSQN